MPDWTTKPLSDRVEVDIHPDLVSFPLVIKDKQRQTFMVLSEDEAHKLMLLLIRNFGGVYSTG